MKQFAMSAAVLLLLGNHMVLADGAAKPMMGVGKMAKPCDMVKSTDDKAPKCKPAGSKTIPGLGKVTLLVAGNIKTGFVYGLTIDGVDKHTYISDTLSVAPDTGMTKIDIPKSSTPKLRVIAKKFVALEVVAKREARADEKSKEVQKWTKYQYLVCKPTQSGIPNCLTREFGTAGGGCTATLGDDGKLSHGCPEIENLDAP